MDMGSLFNLLIVVIIVGAALYLLNLAPIDATIKAVGRVIVVVIALIWALRWLLGLRH